MQSTNIKEIKAAIWRQAFIGDTWVSCDIGQIVAIRRRKGQILAMVRGWKHWHTVESVQISESWLAGVVFQAPFSKEAGILT
jgi:Na+-transporting NADH:ubiquinone oxidoreductase subunit NqrB